MSDGVATTTSLAPAAPSTDSPRWSLARLRPAADFMVSLAPVFWFGVIRGARSPWAFWVRGAYAAVLLLTLWLSLPKPAVPGLSIRPPDWANAAGKFFVRFAWVQLVAIIFIVPGLAAASLARERQSGAMDFLLSCPLSNLEIVFGALGARFAQVGLILIAGLPVVSLTMLLGGVGPSAVALAYMETVAAAVMIAGMSIVVSARSRRARDALLAAYFVLAILFGTTASYRMFGGLTPLIGGSATPTFFDDVSGWLNALDPYAVLKVALTADDLSPLGTPFERCIVPMLWQLAIGLAATLFAVWRVRHWHRRAVGAVDSPRNRRFSWPVPVVYGRQPLLWKELHRSGGFDFGRTGRIVFWLAFLSMAATAATGLPDLFRIGSAVNIGLLNPVAIRFCLVGDLAEILTLLTILFHAATSISVERERETWPGLFATDLTCREILRAKFWGGIYAGRWMAGLAVAILAMPAIASPLARSSFAVWIVQFAAYAAFGATVGLAISARARSTPYAIGCAIVVALLTGGLPIACAFLLRMKEWFVDVFDGLCIPQMLEEPWSHWLTRLIRPDLPFSHVTKQMAWSLIGYSLAAVALYWLTVWRLYRRERRPHVEPAKNLKSSSPAVQEVALVP